MLFRRILAALMMLLAAVMLLLSLGAGVGVWIIKGPTTARLEHTFERIDAAFTVADQGLEQVKSSLTRAQERLDAVRQEQRQAAAEPQRAGAIQRTLARTVQQRLAPEVGDASAKLHTVAEAAVVVNSVLEDLGNLPFLSASGLDTDRLGDMNNQLATVSSSAWELSRLFGEPTADTEAVDAQMNRIDSALKAMQGLVARYEPQLRQVRQRTDTLKAATLAWITPVATVISFVCFWIALSQISLIATARRWWKRG